MKITWERCTFLHFAAAAILLAGFVVTGSENLGKLAAVAVLFGIASACIDMGFGK